MPLISSTDIDNAISRVKNGAEFVKLLQTLGNTNQDIELSIKHYLDTPTLMGEWETIITTQAIQYLKLK